MVKYLLLLETYEAHISIIAFCTFFLTRSAAEFCWIGIVPVAVSQYGEHLSDEQVNNMDCSTKVKYLERNLVTVARDIAYVFKQLGCRIILWNASYWSNFKF